MIMKMGRFGTLMLLAMLAMATPAVAQEAVESLEQLLNEVRAQGQQTSRENQARERAFRQNRDQQKAKIGRAHV